MAGWFDSDSSVSAVVEVGSELCDAVVYDSPRHAIELLVAPGLVVDSPVLLCSDNSLLAYVGSAVSSLVDEGEDAMASVRPDYEEAGLVLWLGVVGFSSE